MRTTVKLVAVWAAMVIFGTGAASAAVGDSQYVSFDYQNGGITYSCSFTLYDLGDGEYSPSGAVARVKRADAESMPVIVAIPRKVTSPDYDGIEFPVESIEAGAFTGCTRLRSLDLSAAAITTIGQQAFSGCTQLRSVKLPSTLVTLSTRAFTGCSALTEMALPEGLQEVGLYLFESCTSLKTVEIPSTVATLGSYLLDGCTSITTVVSHLQSPEKKTLGLPDDRYVNASLYVPKGCAAKYRRLADWNRFGLIVEPGDINGDGSIDSSDVSVLLEMVLDGGSLDADKIYAADVNSDGNVDSSDVSALLEIVLSGN